MAATAAEGHGVARLPAWIPWPLPCTLHMNLATLATQRCPIQSSACPRREHIYASAHLWVLGILAGMVDLDAQVEVAALVVQGDCRGSGV